MSKNAYWFKHDYNAKNDEKILELRSEFGAEGYGIYWMLIESMSENNCGGLKATLIGGLSLGFGVDKGRLTEVVKFCITVGLFFEEKGVYYSQRVLDHKQERKYLSEMGKLGMERKKYLKTISGEKKVPLKPPLQPPLSNKMYRVLLDKENTLSTESSIVRPMGENSEKNEKFEKNGKVNHNSGAGVSLGKTEGEIDPPLPF
jgi:hypothetical protein